MKIQFWAALTCTIELTGSHLRWQVESISGHHTLGVGGSWHCSSWWWNRPYIQMIQCTRSTLHPRHGCEEPYLFCKDLYTKYDVYLVISPAYFPISGCPYVHFHFICLFKHVGIRERTVRFWTLCSLEEDFVLPLRKEFAKMNVLRSKMVERSEGVVISFSCFEAKVF